VKINLIKINLRNFLAGNWEQVFFCFEEIWKFLAENFTCFLSSYQGIFEGRGDV
jgi:hypothetical protein